MDRENIMPFYMDYVNSGGVISPMNTEKCRKYLQEKAGVKVSHEDVLWLFYHAKQGGKHEN